MAVIFLINFFSMSDMELSFDLEKVIGKSIEEYYIGVHSSCPPRVEKKDIACVTWS